MKILRVWFDEVEGDFVYVRWEKERGGRKITELLCATDSVSKAGRIVLAMRAAMRLSPKPRRPRIAGWRSVWSESQHKWQLVRSKTRSKKPTKPAKKKSTKKPMKDVKRIAVQQRSGSWNPSSGALRDTDWHDTEERFRGPRSDSW